MLDRTVYIGGLYVAVWAAARQLRIDTHFADIHGFMNVALVGAIPWTALAVHG